MCVGVWGVWVGVGVWVGWVGVGGGGGVWVGGGGWGWGLRWGGGMQHKRQCRTKSLGRRGSPLGEPSCHRRHLLPLLAAALGTTAVQCSPCRCILPRNPDTPRRAPARCARCSHEGAGLQTGDASLNVDAPVVVMTTGAALRWAVLRWALG